MSFTFDFVPARLHEARIARGKTMQELADSLGVVRQTISRYESPTDILKPSPMVLMKLSSELDFPIGFFSKPAQQSPETAKMYLFRSKKSSDAVRREQISLMGDWTIEVYSYIERFVTMPKINIPDITMYEKNSYSDDEIEEIAAYVRKFWKIGPGPIDNLILMLERNGFIISSADINDDKAEACSTMINGRPFVFLGYANASASRVRLSAAHELGHLILHRHTEEHQLLDAKQSAQIEKEAYRFASAFLMPEGEFTEDIITSRLDHFINIKRRWKVSIAAMVYRCSDLGIFDESQILNIRKQMSSRKYLKVEPLDNEIPKEKPIVLKTAVNLCLENNRITPQDLHEYLKWNYSDIENIIACEKGSLSPTRGIVLGFRNDDSRAN